MRLSFVLAAAAYVGLVVAGQAQAIDPPPSCQTAPASSGCPGPGPGPGPEDPPPPPDPCDLDPSLCEPPPDPCTIDPSLCPPPPDPCVVDPSLCPEEPPIDPEPPVAHVLEGTSRFKLPGFLESGDASVELAYDETNFSYDLAPTCTPATGALIAKGKNGKKFQLILNDDSIDSLAEDLATSARQRAGRGGPVVGKTSKVILRKLPSGDLSLKIKVQVAVEDLGEVVYKANLVTSDGPRLSCEQ
jgi:hypothetical protein